MYCSEEDIIRIRENINIKDYISRKIELTKNGDLYIGRCPFHKSGISSFIVDEKNRTYGCFECGHAGDIFDFIMEYYKKSFSDAVCMAAMMTGIEIKKDVLDKQYYRQQKQIIDINRTAKEFYQKSLYTNDSALEYVKNRNLDIHTLEKYGIGYSDSTLRIYNELIKQGFKEEDIMISGLVAGKDRHGNILKEKERYDKFYNRIIFPIMNENNVVIGFGGRIIGDKKPKYINSPETIIYNKSSNLYGLNVARRSPYDYFLLCEGFMDVISMHQAGFDNAIASLGTSLTMSQILKLSRYKKKIILTYDSDEPGLKAAKRAITMLESCRMDVKVLDLNPYKDPDEFIGKLGNTEFEKRINKAEKAYPWCIKNVIKSEDLPYEKKIDDIADIFEKQYQM
ncbi:DNA primase [Enterocloster aldenensis]|uniref:DNA primase n=1 Tax=Enterocloster aldenensis TaxID=358742 RepID=UPI000E4DFE28|nr:DNA primase [Enterocloster aldenensis]